MEHLVADEERVQWAEHGYVALERPIAGPDALAAVERLLAPLLDRWPDLPSPHAQELGEPGTGIREITMATRLVPALERTDAFAAMRAVASALLERPVVRTHFDHVVAKAPGAPATAWHQDVVFDPDHDLPMATVWLPLVDVDAGNGAMQFLAGSHRGPLREHVPHGRHGMRVRDLDPTGAITCPIPAGACTVHQARTLHASTANAAGGRRVAWVVKFVGDDRSRLRRAVGDRRARRRPVPVRAE